MEVKGHKQKCIIFTGGGSSGHVVPNLAIIEKFKFENWNVVYVGSRNGIERDIIIKETDISYFSIVSGKLRRYFSWQNFIDPFKIIYGIIQGCLLCCKIRPDVVFSKGGFVSFPLVIAAWLNGIPVIAHESDITPGLANKLSFPFVKKICTTFTETAAKLKNNTKVVVTGTPIRKGLLAGNAANGLKVCQFSEHKKVILIIGGGLGSESINKVIRAILPRLLVSFQIIHICGKNKLDNSLENLSGYKQFEYIYTKNFAKEARQSEQSLNDVKHIELADIMACASIVISRAGANSIYELLALRKPHILIPLPLKGSRGDQISNAKYFSEHGLSEVFFEEELSSDALYDKIVWINAHEEEIIKRLKTFKMMDSVQLIYDIITSV